MCHEGSFGYRPGRNAHQAVRQCEEHCRQNAWVIDVDIKGFFDNIDHEVVMELLKKHTQEKWVLMYMDRWLKALVMQLDGSLLKREKGTPQGGVCLYFCCLICHQIFALIISIAQYQTTSSKTPSIS